MTAAHAIAPAVTAIVIVGQWFRSKSRAAIVLRLVLPAGAARSRHPRGQDVRSMRFGQDERQGERQDERLLPALPGP